MRVVGGSHNSCGHARWSSRSVGGAVGVVPLSGAFRPSTQTTRVLLANIRLRTAVCSHQSIAGQPREVCRFHVAFMSKTPAVVTGSTLVSSISRLLHHGVLKTIGPVRIGFLSVRIQAQQLQAMLIRCAQSGPLEALLRHPRCWHCPGVPAGWPTL